MHSVEKQEILSPHQKNISLNQLFSYLFSKTVTFTKFLPKMREREFPQFTHSVEIAWKLYQLILAHFCDFPWNCCTLEIVY